MFAEGDGMDEDGYWNIKLFLANRPSRISPIIINYSVNDGLYWSIEKKRVSEKFRHSRAEASMAPRLAEFREKFRGISPRSRKVLNYQCNWKAHSPITNVAHDVVRFCCAWKPQSRSGKRFDTLFAAVRRSLFLSFLLSLSPCVQCMPGGKSFAFANLLVRNGGIDTYESDSASFPHWVLGFKARSSSVASRRGFCRGCLSSMFPHGGNWLKRIKIPPAETRGMGNEIRWKMKAETKSLQELSRGRSLAESGPFGKHPFRNARRYSIKCQCEFSPGFSIGQHRSSSRFATAMRLHLDLLMINFPRTFRALLLP